jgi:gluconokinase
VTEDKSEAPRLIIVMGVAGAGKTLIGRALATALGWRFYDGDDYHSAANIEKMREGDALSDADRAPWLDALRALIGEVIETGARAVLACSALKQSYRDKLVPEGVPPGAVRWVYLSVPESVLADRLKHRAGHFAPPELLPGQLATLEEPRDALWIDGTRPPEEIVRMVRDAFGV